MRQVHAVFFPFSAQGHTIPALSLAERLVKGGILVTFVVLECRLPRVRDALEFVDIQIGSGFTLEALPETAAAPEGWNGRGHDNEEAVGFMVMQCIQAKAGFEKLIADLERESGNRLCIISDYLLGWTQDVANSLGLPRYLFYPSPASILVGVFYVKALQDENRLPLHSGAQEHVRIPGMPPIKVTDMHSFLLDTTPNKASRDYYADNCRRVHEAAGVLVNTFEDLETTAIKALENKLLNPNQVPIFPIGPLFPSRSQLSSADEKCLLWLQSQPPRSVVYVSLGSIATLTSEQIQELGYGLGASEQRFLWVLRAKSEIKSLEGVLPSGFPGERGLVLSEWVPQLLILQHESTGAFLTHCGWNSTLESIWTGVPMLLLPCFADQAMNAKLVEELQAGVRLERGKNGLLDRQEVERMIRLVMSGSGNRMWDSSKALMTAARRATQVDAPKQLEAFKIALSAN